MTKTAIILIQYFLLLLLSFLFYFGVFRGGVNQGIAPRVFAVTR